MQDRRDPAIPRALPGSTRLDPRRDGILRVLTDLFIHNGAQQSPAERAMHEDLMVNMLAEAGLVMRQEVAERLAAHPAPPPRVMALLARDDIAVSRAVLIHCALLDDALLADIATRTTPEHLDAIARRTTMGERTAQAVLARGDRDAVLAVAGNPAIPLRPDAIETLAARAQRDGALAELLLERGDLRCDLLMALFWPAGEAQRRHMIERMSEESGAGGNDNAGGQAIWLDHVPPLAAPILRGSQESRATVQRGLVAMLMNRRVDEFQAFFAKVLGIAPALMARIVDDAQGEPFAVACKAGGFAQEAFTTMLLLYNPQVGKSVGRVFALGELYKTLADAGCWRMLQSWNASLAQPEASAKPLFQPAVTRAERPARPSAGAAPAPGLGERRDGVATFGRRGG